MERTTSFSLLFRKQSYDIFPSSQLDSGDIIEEANQPIQFILAVGPQHTDA